MIEPSVPPGGQPKKVLVVEDSAIQSELLRRFLAKEGFATELAPDGRKGWEAIQRQPPDLVITDVAMPEMNGFELCRAIKSDRQLRGTPVILLTFLTDPRDLLEGLASGADTYVFKPFEEADLRGKIRLLLGGHRPSEEEEPKPVEFHYQTGTYLIPAGRERILHFLITTYENAVRQSQERMNTQIALQDANETLAIKRNEVEESRALLAERERQQAAVAELGREALSMDSLSLVYDKAATLIARTLGVEFCEVLEALPAHDALILREGKGWKEGLVGSATVRVTDGSLLSNTLDSGEPAIFEDLAAMPLAGSPLLVEHGVVSGVKVIIPGRDEPFGILGAFTGRHRRFSQDDVNFVRAMANVLSAAILRERDQKEIHRLVTTDDLTGMANRREFDRALNLAVKEVERYGRPMSLVMYDLDHFKQVNDSFGHETGDRVLRSISELVRANVRELDILARWGGEEFMILASETTADTAAAMAEKLRGLIAAQIFEQVGMMVTASFGVTELTKGDNPTAVVSRVDEALYQAKQGGRNKVHVVRAADTGS